MKPYQLAVFMLGFSANVMADIYKYVDENGLTFYTDRPKNHSEYKLIIRSQPVTYKADLKHASKNKSKYKDLIAKAAVKHDLDEKLLHAVIQTESAYNASAVSAAGAMGLMQLMPDTAQRYGVTNPYDAEQNINAGARYLKDLLKMFDSNLQLAVAGYNAGEGAVMKYNYNIPPYPETRNYVQQVMQLYKRS